MKKMLLGLTLVIALLTACSSQPTTSVPPTESQKPVVSEVPVIDEPVSSEPVDVKTVGTDLFNDVYVPYATREKDFAYTSVEAFAKNCGYEASITEPTSEILGQIQISDGSGDYVNFVFTPTNGIESIMSVSYFQNDTNSEVIMGNFSTDGAPEYDIFNTHILGEQSDKVTGIEDQKSFLFPQE